MLSAIFEIKKSIWHVGATSAGIRAKKETVPKTQQHQAHGERQNQLPSQRLPVRAQEKGQMHECRWLQQTLMVAVLVTWCWCCYGQCCCFLNSLPRLLLQLHCGLQGFLLTIIKSHTGSLQGWSKAGCTWPGPLPYPETFRPGAAYRISGVRCAPEAAHQSSGAYS